GNFRLAIINAAPFANVARFSTACGETEILARLDPIAHLGGSEQPMRAAAKISELIGAKGECLSGHVRFLVPGKQMPGAVDQRNLLRVREQILVGSMSRHRKLSPIADFPSAAMESKLAALISQPYGWKDRKFHSSINSGGNWRRKREGCCMTSPV